ncbi:hypothetical protein O181_023530 [Austropuccinia psidii MF-1]|uniref:Uncharacterized protein n=1 Tax=Austropuccinia psidii MF-1 TaxID=1389203 RepID=A0A9Q3CIP3_9BASI|nr:hypothetical protein [Austropuccinia psidii MF-1]
MSSSSSSKTSKANNVPFPSFDHYHHHHHLHLHHQLSIDQISIDNLIISSNSTQINLSSSSNHQNQTYNNSPSNQNHDTSSILDKLISLSNQLLDSSNAALASTLRSRNSLSTLSKVENFLDRSIRTRQRELRRRLEYFEERKFISETIDKDLLGWSLGTYNPKLLNKKLEEEAQLTRQIINCERQTINNLKLNNSNSKSLKSKSTSKLKSINSIQSSTSNHNLSISKLIPKPNPILVQIVATPLNSSSSKLIPNSSCQDSLNSHQILPCLSNLNNPHLSNHNQSLLIPSTLYRPSTSSSINSFDQPSLSSSLSKPSFTSSFSSHSHSYSNSELISSSSQIEPCNQFHPSNNLIQHNLKPSRALKNSSSLQSFNLFKRWSTLSNSHHQKSNLNLPSQSNYSLKSSQTTLQLNDSFPYSPFKKQSNIETKRFRNLQLDYNLKRIKKSFNSLID